MKENIYNNRKLIRLISIIILVIGLIMAYYYWGVEPYETISGALCGFGLAVSIFSFSLKKS